MSACLSARTQNSLNGVVRCQVVSAPLGSDAMSPAPRPSVGPPGDLDSAVPLQDEERLACRQRPPDGRTPSGREPREPRLDFEAGAEDVHLAADLGVRFPFFGGHLRYEDSRIALHRPPPLATNETGQQ